MIPRLRLLGSVIALSLLVLGTVGNDAAAEPDISARTRINQRKQLIQAVPPKLQTLIRKYGPCDFKAQSALYQAFSAVMYGSICAKVGIPELFIQELDAASQPNVADIDDFEAADLRGKYPERAATLDRLQTMANKDSQLIRIAGDFTWLGSNFNWPRKDVGITETRWTLYRTLFQQAALTEGIMRNRDYPGATFFIVVTRGLCVDGSSAGYVFSKGPLTPVASSARAAIRKQLLGHFDGSPRYVFSKLRGDWYLFYEAD